MFYPSFPGRPPLLRQSRSSWKSRCCTSSIRRLRISPKRSLTRRNFNQEYNNNLIMSKSVHIFYWISCKNFGQYCIGPFWQHAVIENAGLQILGTRLPTATAGFVILGRKIMIFVHFVNKNAQIGCQIRSFAKRALPGHARICGSGRLIKSLRLRVEDPSGAPERAGWPIFSIGLFWQPLRIWSIFNVPDQILINIVPRWLNFPSLTG